MNKFYYHLCAVPLGVGSIIKAGNWGRIINLYKNKNVPPEQFWILAREQTFELTRLKLFKEKPSRLTSIFLCETEDEIRNFRERNNRFFDVAHKVKILDTSKPMAKCDMNLVNLPEMVNILPTLEYNSEKYWSGIEIQDPEILIESDVEVIEEVIL